jgi:DNA-binding CsgD family transcriptional regulator
MGAYLPEKIDGWPTSADSVGGTLTRREAEIAELVARGFANKVVAGQLGVREGTVKIHLHNIYRKLRVSNRAGLILSAIQSPLSSWQKIQVSVHPVQNSPIMTPDPIRPSSPFHRVWPPLLLILGLGFSAAWTAFLGYEFIEFVGISF